MSPRFEEHVLRAAADGKAANRGGLGKIDVMRAIWAVSGLGDRSVRRVPGRKSRLGTSQLVARSSKAVRRILRDNIDEIVRACAPEGEVIGHLDGAPVREVRADDARTHGGAVPPRRYQTRLAGQAMKPATQGMTPQAMQRQQQQRDARVAEAAAAAVEARAANRLAATVRAEERAAWVSSLCSYCHRESGIPNPPHVWSSMCQDCRDAGRVPRSWGDQREEGQNEERRPWGDRTWIDQDDDGQVNGGWRRLPYLWNSTSSTNRGGLPTSGFLVQPANRPTRGWGEAGLDGWGQPSEYSWGGADWGTGFERGNGGGWAAGFERGNGWGQIPRRAEEEIEE